MQFTRNGATSMASARAVLINAAASPATLDIPGMGRTPGVPEVNVIDSLMCPGALRAHSRTPVVNA